MILAAAAGSACRAPNVSRVRVFSLHLASRASSRSAAARSAEVVRLAAHEPIVPSSSPHPAMIWAYSSSRAALYAPVRSAPPASGRPAAAGPIRRPG